MSAIQLAERELSYLSGDAENRQDQRHTRVLIVARVSMNGLESACLIQNVSHGGLMARVARPVLVGDRLNIEARGLPMITGSVRWTEGDRIGVKFDEQQDIQRLLERTNERGRIVRSPRFILNIGVKCSIANKRFSSLLSDISLGGVKLSGQSGMSAGNSGSLIFPDGNQYSGQVCWIRQDEFGFRFGNPLSITNLERILRTLVH